MSPYFLDGTPVLEVILENPIMNKRFPSDGEALAVVDTGYEGFLLVPESIFHELSLEEFATDQRQLVLANGLSVRSVGTFGKVVLSSFKIRFDGFIEAVHGAEEIVAGTELIRNFTITLDYCVRKIEANKCK